MKYLNLVLLALISNFSLISCVSLPGGGKKAFIMIPRSQEKSLGQEAFKEIMKKEKRSSNQRWIALLKQVGHRIAKVAPVDDFNWEFELVESKQMNAFCLPGGKVVFYTGIFSVLENEAAMAIVMGHEVAHAVQRHGAQRMSQAIAVQGLLTMADLSLKNSENHNLIMGMLGVGSTVGLVLPFSRSNESEADGVGLEYAAKAGYDPNESVRFWTRFSSATSSGAPPEFLSTHPSGKTRISDLEKFLPEALAKYQQSPKYGLGAKL